MKATPETLRSAFEMARSSLTNPASNPRGALLALITILVLLMILIIVVAIGVSLVSNLRRSMSHANAPAIDPAERKARDAASRARARRTAAWTSLAVVLIVAAVFIAGLGFTSSNSFCERCHFTQRAREAAARSVHGSVPCRSCHEAGGLSAYVDAKVRGAGNLTAQLRGRVPSRLVPSAIADGACINCHRGVLAGTSVSRGIRVKHSDFLQIGYRCADCHNTEGHGNSVARPKYPQMRTCITCHDGVRVSSECKTCHSKDVGTMSREAQTFIPRVIVSRDNCRGCHSMQPCIDCHGLELPHSQKFVEGYHAREAFLHPNTCEKCHDLYKFCNGCHHFRVGLQSADGRTRIRSEHPADWVTLHANWRAGCGCHAIHTTAEICVYCHGQAVDH